MEDAQSPTLHVLGLAVEELLKADSLEDFHRVVQAHPELLTQQAQSFLAELSAGVSDGNFSEVLAYLRRVLDRCMTVGTSEVIAELHLEAASPDLSEAIATLHGLEAQHNEMQDPKLVKLIARGWTLLDNEEFFETLDVAIRRHILEKRALASRLLYLHSSEFDDLEDQITSWRRLLAITPPEHMPFNMSRLGGALVARYEHTGEATVLHESVDLQRQAVALGLPPDEDIAAAILNNLGSSLGVLFKLSQNDDDLDAQIEALEAATACRMRDSSIRAGAYANLGVARKARYDYTGDLADLDASISSYEVALDTLLTTGAPQEQYSMCLHTLGNGLVAKYIRTRTADLLARAIRLWEESLRLTPHHSPYRPLRMSSLAGGLRETYLLHGLPRDRDRAIKLWVEAISLCPPDSPHMPVLVSNLSTALSERYSETGTTEGLAEAIHVQSAAVQRSPLRSLSAAQSVRSLAEALKNRFFAGDADVELDTIVTLQRMALTLMPPDPPHLRTGAIVDLGKRLRERFELRGNEDDLEEAIEILRPVVNGPHYDSLAHNHALTTLGLALMRRYLTTRNVKDLNQARSLHEEAITLGENAWSLTALANSLLECDRAFDLEDPATLERAVALLERALNHPTEPDWAMAATLTSLAAALERRYDRLSRLTDLDSAISAYDHALSLLAAKTPIRAWVLHNRGEVYRKRYCLTGAAADLDSAVKAHTEALAIADEDHPDGTQFYTFLGEDYWEAFLRTDEEQFFELAVSAWERGWQAQESSPRASLMYKIGAGTVSHLLNRLGEAYSMRGDGPSLRRALICAESAKARLVSETLGRGDLAAPREAGPGTISREQALVKELRTIEQLAIIQPDSSASVNQSTTAWRRRRGLAGEVEELWAVIETSGDAGREYVALRRGMPPRWEEFVRSAEAAGDSTVLFSLQLSADRARLILYRSGWDSPKLITGEFPDLGWLDRYVEEVAEYPHYGSRSESWLRPLLPLFERALPDLKGAERVLLAPGAIGDLLPWSVIAVRAGCRTVTGSALPIVSLPSLAMLPTLLRRSPGTGEGALVVGNPEWRDPARRLPYAEEEAAAVAELLGSTPLLREQATKEAVSSALKERSVVHLATHALSSDQPLDSGIYLADGVLTAREILAEGISADLVVLSACETGLVQRLENTRHFISLAQSCLMAGARSVVATLWPISDRASARLIVAFYTKLLAGHDRAAALANAMEEVRVERSWSHSFYWASFVLVGDWRSVA